MTVSHPAPWWKAVTTRITWRNFGASEQDGGCFCEQTILALAALMPHFTLNLLCAKSKCGNRIQITPKH